MTGRAPSPRSRAPRRAARARPSPRRRPAPSNRVRGGHPRAPAATPRPRADRRSSASGSRRTCASPGPSSRGSGRGRRRSWRSEQTAASFRRYSATISSSSPSTVKTSSMAWRASGSSGMAPSIASSASRQLPLRGQPLRGGERPGFGQLGPVADLEHRKDALGLGVGQGGRERLACLVLASGLGVDPSEPHARVAVGRVDLEGLPVLLLGVVQVPLELLLERVLRLQLGLLGMSLSTNSFTIGSGIAPTKPSIGCPSRKATTVGMLWTPNCPAVYGLASTSSLASRNAPPAPRPPSRGSGRASGRVRTTTPRDRRPRGASSTPRSRSRGSSGRSPRR